MTALADPSHATTARTQASGSSFYMAMRLLPLAEREAMFAIYAFCREVDDIADEAGFSPGERRAALDGWRRDLDGLFFGAPTAKAGFLAEPVRRFALAKDDFLAIIDGMQMDVDETIRAPSFEAFDLYCDRVAGAVGRLSVRVFGMAQEPGRTLAHHLGRALQFTNILRDIDEDAAMGRLYLPREALEGAGIETREPATALAHLGIDQACRWVAALAHEHYRAADAVMSARPAGRLRAPRLMSAVYGEILRRMEAQGWDAPRTRVKLRKSQIAWIVLRRGLLG